MKKLISWNVNGLRACVGKGFLDVFQELDADIFCIQESKLQAGQIDLDIPGYYQYWSYADKKGYSGTALFTKEEPLSVVYGLGIDVHDHEGRVLTLEYPGFYLVRRLLCGDLLYAQFPERAGPPALPDGVGGRVPLLS